MMTNYLDPFLFRAILAGVGIAIIAGVIGCFVVWRKMAYFGDSLAHSSLLGIAFGIAINVNTNITTTLVCFIFALLLLWLDQKKLLATDTLLGILAHAALSIGLVTISFMNQKIDIHSYLFGDILTVTSDEIWHIYIGGFIVISAVIIHWSSFILITIHEELAKAENIKAFYSHLILLLLLTIVVAVSIRIVGILLITSLLIIPAATARQFSRSPEMMAIKSSLFGVIAVLLGIYGSYQLDTPSGPSIVATSAILFIILFPFSVILAKKRNKTS
jgi:zinc transport system permease protein